MASKRRRNYTRREIYWKAKRLTFGGVSFKEPQYEQLFAAQQGACAVCGDELQNVDTLGRTCVDHCYDTGEVRALLHNRCNVMVGYVENYPAAIAGAIEFVAAWAPTREKLLELGRAA